MPIQPLHHTLLALLLLLLAGCSAEPPPQMPRLPGDARVLAFGDSLTYGTGARVEEAYPAVFAALTGFEVINDGIPGELSEQGLARLPAALDEVEPDLLVLCHGGNDLLRHKSEAALVANLRQMVREAQQRGVAVVMLGVPRPELFSLESAEFYAEVAAQAGIPLDAEVLPRVISDADLRSDRVHPNAAGYRQIAEAVRDMLVESGAIAPP